MKLILIFSLFFFGCNNANNTSYNGNHDAVQEYDKQQRYLDIAENAKDFQEIIKKAKQEASKIVKIVKKVVQTDKQKEEAQTKKARINAAEEALRQTEAINKAAKKTFEQTLFALKEAHRVTLHASIAEEDARTDLLIAKSTNENTPIGQFNIIATLPLKESQAKIAAFTRQEDSFSIDRTVLKKMSTSRLTDSSPNYNKNLKSKPSETNRNPSSKTNKRVVTASATPFAVSSTITKVFWSLLVFIAVIFCAITIIHINKAKKSDIAGLKYAKGITEAATSIVKTSKETAGYVKEVQKASTLAFKSAKKIKESKTSIVKASKETAKYAKEAKKAAAIAMESTKEIKKNSTPSLQISKRTVKYATQDKRSTTSPFKKPNDISSEHAKKKAA